MAQLLSAVSWAFWSRLVGPPLKLWFIFFILWWKWRIVGSKKIGHLWSTRNQRQTLRAHQQQILNAHEVSCTTILIGSFFFRKPILIGSWIEYLSPHQIVLRGWHSPMWVPLIHGRGIHGMTYRPGIPIGPWWSRNHVIFAIFI
jgi:hypothetical protein